MNDKDEWFEKLTPVGKKAYRIGEVIMGILAVLCLIGWVQDGSSLWEIIKYEFGLLLVTGLIVLVVVHVIDGVAKSNDEINGDD